MPENEAFKSAQGARYDGWAEWYDNYLRNPIYADLPDYVARLTASGTGLCIDVGCGTGVYFQTLTALGWSVAGLDISADQLRLASRRHQTAIQADAGQLPFPDGIAARVVSVLTLTDFDDPASFFLEAERVLHPGGRLVIITPHPCFTGPFIKTEDGGDRAATIYPGYWHTDRVFEGPGIGDGVRARVGVRHVPMSLLFNELLASGLQLERVEEFGDAAIPWLLGLVAIKRVPD